MTRGFQRVIQVENGGRSHTMPLRQLKKGCRKGFELSVSSHVVSRESTRKHGRRRMRSSFTRMPSTYSGNYAADKGSSSLDQASSARGQRQSSSLFFHKNTGAVAEVFYQQLAVDQITTVASYATPKATLRVVERRSPGLRLTRP